MEPKAACSKIKTEVKSITLRKQLTSKNCQASGKEAKMLSRKIESSNKSQIKSTNSTPQRSQTKASPVLPSKPMPFPQNNIKNFNRRHSDNYSENEKKRRQKHKREYENQVGWQQRRGRHRHPHQARREKEFINFMNGLPLDYNCDSD